MDMPGKEVRNMVAPEKSDQRSAVPKVFVETLPSWIEWGDVHKNEAVFCRLRIFQDHFQPFALGRIESRFVRCIQNNEFVLPD
jgi:hypothetical protein